ncbi:MAG TPA: Wzz/FepE/Etk N-terminal domain-containing protein, partial [Sphingomonas sp.]|nr:Wzz/FepE/Etk N-terminal domain-containing protein [Sphingomonas sp.]
MDSRVANTEALSRSASMFPSGLKPVDLLRVLRRRRTLILATVLAITGLATLIVLFVPPIYSATATLRVDDDDDAQVRPTDTAASIREAELRRQARISTLIEVVRSRALAKTVALNLALHDDPEFSPAAAAERNANNPGLWHRFKRLVGLEAASVVKQRGKRRAPPQHLTAEQMKVPVDRLLDQIDVAQDGQSNLVNVTARSSTPAKAQRIANKFAST